MENDIKLEIKYRKFFMLMSMYFIDKKGVPHSYAMEIEVWQSRCRHLILAYRKNIDIDVHFCHDSRFLLHVNELMQTGVVDRDMDGLYRLSKKGQDYIYEHYILAGIYIFE